jgi:XTP/dITP diphosphohydrolase
MGDSRLTLKSLFPRGRVAFFATSNVHKFKEAQVLLAEYGLAAALLRVKIHEIQDDNIENIAEASALEAAEKCKLPIIVEDAGLFIEALSGFPGPYSSYVYRTLGTRGVLKLMSGLENRSAYFRSVVAFCDSGGSVECFDGKVFGRIVRRERGSSGFGFDPIFEPLGGGGKTFAEMTTEEKNRYSHRARALRKFAEWYISAFRRRF